MPLVAKSRLIARTELRRSLRAFRANRYQPLATAIFGVLFLLPMLAFGSIAARELGETFAAREMTIFLSTHVLPVVDELADRVGVIHDGRLVAEGAPEELKRRAETGEQRSLEDAFLDVTHDTPELEVPDR